MARNVILYGGGFDPIHIGHENLAKLALNSVSGLTGEPHELWFLPSYSDSFGLKNFVAGRHRMQMIEIVVSNYIKDPRVRVCPFELKAAKRAGTYATINAMKKVWPNVDFKFLVGYDQANQIRKWRNSRKLLRSVPFIVFPRRSFIPEFRSSWFRKPPHCCFNVIPYDHIVSSTILRAQFSNPLLRNVFRKTTNVHLRPLVQEYIFDNHLYKGDPNE